MRIWIAKLYFFPQVQIYIPIGTLDIHPETVRGHWSPPHVRWYKVNFDASMPKHDVMRLVEGIAAVLRDHTWLILAWRRKKIIAHLDVATAEAYAARRGILLAQQFGCQKLVLECDALEVIRGMQYEKNHLVVQGTLYANLRELLVSFSEATIQTYWMRSQWFGSPTLP